MMSSEHGFPSYRARLRALRRVCDLGLIVALCIVAPALGSASEQSELLTSRGLVEFHRGSYAKALELFTQAVQTDPSDIYARYYQGVTQGRLGNFTAAAADLRTVMEAKPDLNQGALELGVALLETGQSDEAIGWLTKAQQVPALEADASFYLGIAQLRARELDAARANLEKAIRLKPDLTLAARYYLGVVEYREGNFTQAAEHFEWVIATSPDSAVAEESRGFLANMARGPGAVPGQVTTARPYQVFGAVGLEYDSNVQLLPNDDALDPIVGTDTTADGRGIISFGGLYSPVQREDVQFSIGYSFFQTLQFDLTEFNLQDHRPMALVTVPAGPVRLNLLAQYDFYLRETSAFLSQVTAVPWLSAEEGSFGRVEAFYRFRYRDFLEDPFEDVLTGYLNGFGGTQFIYLGAPDRFFSLGYQFATFDPTGNDNAFGYTGNQVNTGLAWAFPFDIWSEIAFAYTYRNYRSGSNGRQDNEYQFVAAIDKYFADYFFVTLAYLGVINNSNQAIFEYDRNVVSLSVGVRY